MLNFDKDEYNEVTYQITQALLFKVTDGLLAISFELTKNKLDVRAYFDTDKISDLDKKLMADFESEIKKCLFSYEVECVTNEVSTSNFDKESIGTALFLRFNELWW